MKQIPNDVFEHATSSTVKVIGRDVGVRVVFAGDQACNNGNTIYLPKLPEGTTISEDDAGVIRGYADHETLHSLLTDFGEATRKKGVAGPLLSALMNAIEDVRIEKGGAQLYAGMPKHIAHVAEATALKAVEGASEEDLSNWKCSLPIAVTWAGRMSLGTAGDKTRSSWDKLSKDVQDKANAVVNAIHTLDTGCEKGFLEKERAHEGCRQGVALAERIFHDLKKEEEEKEKEKEKEKSDDGDVDGPVGNHPATGDDDEGGSNSKGEGEGEDEGEEKSPSGERHDGGTGSGKSGGLGGSELADDEANVEDRIIDGSFEGSANHVFDSLRNESNGTSPYNVVTKDQDIEITRENVKKSAGLKRSEQRRLSGSYTSSLTAEDQIAKGMRKYHECASSMGGIVGVMKRKLERALLAQERRFYESGHTSGKFDSKRALSVVLGADNVFKRKMHGMDLSTSVTVLVDLSGSMDGQKAQLAMKSCIALSEALEMTHVRYEVLGFRTGALNRHDLDGASFHHKIYARKGTIEGFVFKEFKESLRQARWFMGHIEAAVGGANADGESVRWAAERLLKEKAKKHVLLVLSDGEPACDSDSTALLYKHLRDTVAWVESKQIDVIGLGIMSGAVSLYYPKHVVVNSLDDLSKTVIDQIGRMLVGNRFKVDNSELIQGNARSVKRG